MPHDMTFSEPAIGLDALETRVRRDLAITAHPRMVWLEPKLRDGVPIRDVLVIGAGQSGVCTAFALLRDRVDNLLVIDRAPYGREGPWATFARMPTLRSPKDQTGPDLDVASLTFQAWFEAQHGARAFEALHLIPRGQWNDYLLWFRAVTGVPVRNGVGVIDIAPEATDDGGRCLRATLDTGETLWARKIVLATGQDGTGRWWMPDFVEALPPSVRAHTCDEIDFAALRGRTVAVLGAGASAFDNAATALEHGATVHLFCRRAEPMVVQRYRWLTFAGFLRHLGDMPDGWRWRFMAHILGMREGFPADTYARVMRHDAFSFHAGRGWTGAAMRDGRVAIETERGPFDTDFMICGTGIVQDFSLRPELSRAAGEIARWSDRYAPPEAERDDRLAAFAYLGPDYAFQQRVPGRAPWIEDIHLFGIGSTMSFGPSGSSINAMTIAVPKLAAGVTRGLFAADIAAHWAGLLAYDVPQVELDPARVERG